MKVSFFRRKEIEFNNIKTTKQQIKFHNFYNISIKRKASSLQTFINRFTPRKRKFITSKKGQFHLPLSRGSLTVETAMILPIFLWVMCFLIYFSKVIGIDSAINNAIYNAGREMALYSYSIDNLIGDSEIAEIVEYGIDNGYVKQSIKSQLGNEFFEYADIENGINGINLMLSRYDEELIDITAYYYVNLPFGIIGDDNRVKLVSKCRVRKWTGYEYDENGNIEFMVYVTPNGQVYHMTSTCSHIEIFTTKVSRTSVKNMRNTNGDKYTECSICKKSTSDVYITQTGNKYHTDKYCSGIKRTVFRVPLWSVRDKGRCSRCGG